MILSIGNTKGGVGKTMLAVNIAVGRALVGADVILINGDKQPSAADFTEMRASVFGAAGYDAVTLLGKALATQALQLQNRYQEVVIDVGGHDNPSLRYALLASDIVLIPVQPRSVDVWALTQMAELVTEARITNENLRALVVLNITDPQGRDNEEAAEAIRETAGLALLPVMIGRRKAFPNAFSSGRSVLEYSPRDAKACDELSSLIRLIYEL